MATAITATVIVPPATLVASAPLVLEALAAWLVWAAAPAAVTLDVVIPLAPVEVAPVPPEAVGEAVPPIGAVDCPLISACTDALNVPDMPDMLNLAENARAGY